MPREIILLDLDRIKRNRKLSEKIINMGYPKPKKEIHHACSGEINGLK